MDVSCLNMRSQTARLNLDITQPKAELSIKDPQVQIDSAPATLEIHTTDSRLEIDSSAFRAEVLGMKAMIPLTRDIAAQGAQSAGNYIAAVKSEGSMMAAPHGDGKASANYAAQHTFDPWPEMELTNTVLPDIHYTPSEVSVDARPGNLDIRLDRGQAQVNLNRGTVRGYVDPKQSLQMWVTKNKYDIYK